MGPPWTRAGILQTEPATGLIDLRPGYPDPQLAPTDVLPKAVSSAVATFGAASLAYGADRGPLPLLELLRATTLRWDDLEHPTEGFLLTAGTSAILDHLAGTLARPGDVAIVEATTYNLACSIFRQHGLDLVSVASDDHGIDPTALDRALGEARAAGRRAAFAYLIPTFHNPTGRVMPVERRRQIIAVAAAHQLLVLEDNAYREIVLDDIAVPPSLLALAGDGGVLQLSTFSKCLAPGLRIGWAAGAPDLVRRIAAGGVFVSGGGANHFVALAVAALLATDWFDQHLRFLRAQLAARRDALVAGLRSRPSPGLVWADPAGGFFLWIELPDGTEEADLVERAQDHGVAVLPGSHFALRPAQPAVRLAFSFNSADDLRRAGERLAEAWLGHDERADVGRSTRTPSPRSVDR